MTTVYRNQRWERVRLGDNDVLYQDLEFHNCDFDHCLITPADWDREGRATVRNCRLVNCKLTNGSVAFDTTFVDCEIDGWVSPRLTLHGCLLRNVVLKGNVGWVKINDEPLEFKNEQHMANWWKLYEDHYAAVEAAGDFAIDVTEARFVDGDLGGIPGHLVRSDPNTSITLSRELILANAQPWDEAKRGKREPGHFWLMLSSPHRKSTVILAADAQTDPKGFEKDMKYFDYLRGLGVVEAGQGNGMAAVRSEETATG